MKKHRKTPLILQPVTVGKDEERQRFLDLPGLRGTTFICCSLTRAASAGNPYDAPDACSRGRPASSTSDPGSGSSRSFRAFFTGSGHISFHRLLTLCLPAHPLLFPAMPVHHLVVYSDFGGYIML